MSSPDNNLSDGYTAAFENVRFGRAVECVLEMPGCRLNTSKGEPDPGLVYGGGGIHSHIYPTPQKHSQILYRRMP